VILAIDQGTTGTTCLVIDDELRVRGRGYVEIEQFFPQPGWVEHDPEELWSSVLTAAESALVEAGTSASGLNAIGITNQRETTLVWERRTGRPVARAIVWQDRRTAERCRELPTGLIRERTGLVPDPYFSATKLEWLLERTDVPPAELAVGTVDSWLVWKLTGGREHVTDITNASRTMLLDLASGDWDDELLGLFGVERDLLPRVVGSSEVVGEAELFGATVPVAGIAGDQQAALFGQACFEAGQAKATYGTGSFVLVNVGSGRDAAPEGLLRTAVAVAPGARPQFALEGSVLVGGAAVQWLRDGLGLVASAAETEALARSVDSSGGVVFVPALTGLGSPWWDAAARGLISGLTRGTTRAHLVRATLEAIAFQVADVLDALPGGVEILRADGGATANGFLMQFQADLLGCPVEVAAEAETTALGAAALAGLAVGVWPDIEAVAALVHRGARYEPSGDAATLKGQRAEWRLALSRARLHRAPD
jgi:glycerol kinase